MMYKKTYKINYKTYNKTSKRLPEKIHTFLENSGHIQSDFLTSLCI